MNTSFLNIYMNDHLAGAVVALQLMERLIDSAHDPDWRQFFVEIRKEIREDKVTLEHLLERIGGRRSVLRQAGGWATEKIGHLKFQFDDPVAGSLERLQAVETVTLGIQGKLGLWRALREIASEVPELDPEKLDHLIRRATDQHARMESRRVQVARNLLHSHPASRSDVKVGMFPLILSGAAVAGIVLLVGAALVDRDRQEDW